MDKAIETRGNPNPANISQSIPAHYKYVREAPRKYVKEAIGTPLIAKAQPVGNRLIAEKYNCSPVWKKPVVVVAPTFVNQRNTTTNIEQTYKALKAFGNKDLAKLKELVACYGSDFLIEENIYGYRFIDNLFSWQVVNPEIATTVSEILAHKHIYTSSKSACMQIIEQNNLYYVNVFLYYANKCLYTVKDDYGMGVIEYSITMCHEKIDNDNRIALLLIKEDRYDAINNAGWTGKAALEFAICYYVERPSTAMEQIICSLICKGAKINRIFDGNKTVLEYICSMTDIKLNMVSWLLKSGADIFKYFSSYELPHQKLIDYAVISETNKQKVKKLFREPIQNGKNYLQIALIEKKLDIVADLLKFGVDVNVEDIRKIGISRVNRLKPPVVILENWVTKILQKKGYYGFDSKDIILSMFASFDGNFSTFISDINDIPVNIIGNKRLGSDELSQARAVLGVSRNATAADIESAFRELRLRYYPNKQSDLAMQGFTAITKGLNAAYYTLINSL